MLCGTVAPAMDAKAGAMGSPRPRSSHPQPISPVLPSDVGDTSPWPKSAPLLMAGSGYRRMAGGRCRSGVNAWRRWWGAARSARRWPAALYSSSSHTSKPSSTNGLRWRRRPTAASYPYGVASQRVSGFLPRRLATNLPVRPNATGGIALRTVVSTPYGGLSHSWEAGKSVCMPSMTCPSSCRVPDLQRGEAMQRTSPFRASCPPRCHGLVLRHRAPPGSRGRARRRRAACRLL